jgi:UDP-N-acetylglucosamine 2-epimerase
MPEENNRILTDDLSRYLFAPTKNAKKILRMGNIHGKIYYTADSFTSTRG